MNAESELCVILKESGSKKTEHPSLALSHFAELKLILDSARPGGLNRLMAEQNFRGIDQTNDKFVVLRVLSCQ